MSSEQHVDLFPFEGPAPTVEVDQQTTTFVELPDMVLSPWQGRLAILKTQGEVKAKSETFDIYAIEIAAKSANAIISSIKAMIPNLGSVDFQHLKRIVKKEYLPPHVQDQFASPYNSDVGSPESSVVGSPESTAASPPPLVGSPPPFIGSPMGSPGLPSPVVGSPQSASSGYFSSGGSSKPKRRRRRKDKSDVRYMAVAPASLIEEDKLQELLAADPLFAQPLKLVLVPVPAFAPTSLEEAEDWSVLYWPISYKNTNPYGPHPAIVSRAEADVAPYAGSLLSLATVSANRTYNQGMGPPVGCVIVDHTESLGKGNSIIAAAGDGRWALQDEKCGTGNVMAHAVQRAIGMVGQKRLRVAQAQSEKRHPRNSSNHQPSISHQAGIFHDQPHSDVESTIFALENVAPNGYLCTDLDLYVTHEPCIMCCMAILHSRFRRCVIGKRMPTTGGMCSDGGGLGYGIFWRPSELNWKMLAWEWMSDYNSENQNKVEDFHA